jgi:uridine kinase
MKYIDVLKEGYLLSDKTISVNLSEFKSGKIKKILIVGVSGSGKTTLGEKLAKHMKVKWYSIDSFWWRLKQEHFPNRSKHNEMTPEERKQLDSLFDKRVHEVLTNNERCIIEGINLMEPQFRKLVLKHALIVLGLSSLRAGIRGGIRNKKRGHNGWWDMITHPLFNMKNIEPNLKSLRKDIERMPGAEIKEYGSRG